MYRVHRIIRVDRQMFYFLRVVNKIFLSILKPKINKSALRLNIPGARLGKKHPPPSSELEGGEHQLTKRFGVEDWIFAAENKKKINHCETIYRLGFDVLATGTVGLTLRYGHVVGSKCDPPPRGGARPKGARESGWVEEVGRG